VFAGSRQLLQQKLSLGQDDDSIKASLTASPCIADDCIVPGLESACTERNARSCYLSWTSSADSKATLDA